MDVVPHSTTITSTSHSQGVQDLIDSARTVNLIHVAGGISTNATTSPTTDISQNFLEGTKLGKCFYEKCKKEIRRDYSPTGEGISYYVCSNKCGGECIHDTCLERFLLEPENSRHRQITRVCNKCNNSIVLETEVAVIRVLVHWFFGWPWWFLTCFVPIILVAGFLFKFWWFFCVVYGRYPVDTWNNPALAPIANSTQAALLPHLSLRDFASYNFCKSSDMGNRFCGNVHATYEALGRSVPVPLARACSMFAHEDDEMQYCSYGGFSCMRFYRIWMFGMRLPLALPFFDHGHFWMGAYTCIYVFVVPYLLMRYELHRKIWGRMSRGFRRPHVRKLKTGGVGHRR